MNYIRNITIQMGVDNPAAKVTIEWLIKPDFPDGLRALVRGTLYDPLGIADEILELGGDDGGDTKREG